MIIEISKFPPELGFSYIEMDRTPSPLQLECWLDMRSISINENPASFGDVAISITNV